MAEAAQVEDGEDKIKNKIYYIKNTMATTAQKYFLYIFLGVVSILLFSVLKPFIYTLILAIVFAVLFAPVYRKILSLTHNKRGLSAFLCTALVLLFIITPFILLGIQIFHEAQQIYFSLTEGREGTIIDITKSLVGEAQARFPVLLKAPIDIEQYAKNAVSWVVAGFGPFVSGLIAIIINAVIFLLAFYYLLKDGEPLKQAFIDASPLSREENEIILGKLTVAIDAVMKGSLIIAIVQGVVAGIGFALFGVPNPVLWGSVASLASLIPSIGTGAVVVPVILYLYLNGAYGSALGMIIWGLFAVGLIDNYLAPKIVSSRSKIHPLLVLLSVLGGVSFFGPIGFLLGPLTLSLFLALFTIYSSLSSQKTLE